MNALLTPEQQAVRRLLFEHPKKIKNAADFQAYMDDIIALSITPDNVLVGQAFEEWKKSHRIQGPKVRNPYVNIIQNPFTIADGSYKPPEEDDGSKKSGRGRKTGSLNQPGHNAGGDRRSINAVPRAPDQGTLTFMGPGGADDNEGEGGAEDGAGGDVERERREERERRRKALEERATKEAMEGLEAYARSIPGGTIDTHLNYEGDDGDNTDEDAAGGDSQSRGKKGKSNTRRSYIPKSGAVKEHLDQVEKRVRSGDSTLNLEKGGAWVPPTFNPISKGLGADATPDQYYRGDTWAFVWHPMVQFQRLMPAKFTCIKCSSTNTRINDWKWRPMHWWDKIVYVLHQRVSCNDCRAEFATIDAPALSTLPTRVAEQFPFMSPSPYSPGLYTPMVLLFVALLPHSILFGTFASVINVLLHYKYSKTHLSYLDEVDHWKNIQKPPVVNCSVPKVFSPFTDQTGYCGIKLLKSILKGCLRVFMKAHEPYMQASFQVAVDEGCSSDDSHKLTKHIYATVGKGKKKVQPFTATYTIIGLNGKVNISRYKYTKSAQELGDLIPDWALVRENAGYKELLRLEGDNAAGDSSHQISASPSLLKDVVPYEEYTALPRYTLSADDFLYLTTKDGCKNVAMTIPEYIQKMTANGGTVRMGLDTEFDSDGVHLVSMDFEGDGPSMLLHFYNSEWADTFEAEMKKIMELDCVVIIGVNIATDIHKLQDRFGIKFKRVRELRRYCLHDDPTQRTSLQALAANYLGVHVDKSHQRSNFNVRPPLPPPLRIYAMGDAMLPLKIDDAITARIANAGINSAQHPPDLQPGTEVLIKIGGIKTAIATIDMLGERGANAGESRMWGIEESSIYIGAGKALVKLVTVMARGSKVPYQHPSWGTERLTFGMLHDRNWDEYIAVNSSQIYAKISSGGDYQKISLGTRSRGATSDHPISAGDVSNDNNEEVTLGDDPIISSAPSAPGPNNDCIEEVADAMPADSDDDIIRSREKSDIWHEHDNVPLKKDCPASPFIHNLLRHATHAIDINDEANVKAVLTSKGIEDFDDHFFFNKEYWYARVRMPPRKADKGSDYLLRVLDFLRNDDTFKEFLTPDLEKHIKGWARRCREGRYEDLIDVEMYRHNGIDSDGLNLYQRRRGSKAENFHQKMKVSVGPYGIGIETSHYLLVNLAYQYNVNAGVARCGEPDFGHFLLHVEDRIQIRIQEIWGVNIFTNRINVSQFQPLDFVAVGVGPLTHNEKYVEKGKPAAYLNDDLKFGAEKMGVVYPPMPPSTKAELGMIKRFCGETPQPKEVDVQRLCATFKSRSNGVDILPKIPSMVKPAVKKWIVNQRIEMLKLQSGKSYEAFLESLRSDKVSLSPLLPANANPISAASTASSAPATENDSSAPQMLPPPHVPPLSAPAQTTAVPVSDGAAKYNSGRCAYWPVCKDDRIICGGIRKELCKTYGNNGKQVPPSEEKLAYERRLHYWDETMQNQNCFWWPFCGKAIICGGLREAECSNYRPGGARESDRPSKDVLAERKKEARKQQRKDRRAKA